MFDPAARTARSAPGALAGSREICGKIGSHRVGAWHSPVAQSVERLTVNQEVAGSSPARGANYFEHLLPPLHAVGGEKRGKMHSRAEPSSGPSASCLREA